jgi:hypothetical protein
MKTNRLHLQTHLKAGQAFCEPGDTCQLGEWVIETGQKTMLEGPAFKNLPLEKCWSIAADGNALLEEAKLPQRLACFKVTV